MMFGVYRRVNRIVNSLSVDMMEASHTSDGN